MDHDGREAFHFLAKELGIVFDGDIEERGVGVFFL